MTVASLDSSSAPRGFWHSSPGLIVALLLVALTSVLDMVVPPLGIPLALLVIWLLLRAAQERWRDLGLGRPVSWPRTFGLALLAAVAMQGITILIVAPALQAAGLPLPDLSRFAELAGNLPMLLLFLVVSWTTAGFGEEVIWRGFILGRLARLFGGSRGAWIGGLVVTSLIFGLLHAYQGPTGIVLTGVAGLFFGILYLVSGRNLWLAILAHAFTDTISFLLLYSGWAGELLG